MIGDEVVQAAIIAKIKSLAPYTSSFGSVASVEVREYEWQGDTFTYPNIRVELEDSRFYFDEQGRCNLQLIEFSVYIFSEQKSSKECSQIKTQLLNSLTGLGFSNQPLGLRFTPLRLVDNVPAVRQDERTWRSQIKLSTKVSTL